MANVNHTTLVLVRINARVWMRKFRRRDLTPAEAKKLGIWLNENPLHVAALEYAMSEAVREVLVRIAKDQVH